MPHYLDNLIAENNIRHGGLITDITTVATVNAVVDIVDGIKYTHMTTGSTLGLVLRFPNATTLLVGQRYDIWNASTVQIVVRFNDNTGSVTLNPGSRAIYILQHTGWRLEEGG
jgi:hypothetical protein